MSNTYEINFSVSKTFGTVLTPTRTGGRRVLCGIRVEHGWATLSRRTCVGHVFAEHTSLGHTPAMRTETVKIHMIGNDAIRVAHEVIETWIADSAPSAPLAHYEVA